MTNQRSKPGRGNDTPATDQAATGRHVFAQLATLPDNGDQVDDRAEQYEQDRRRREIASRVRMLERDAGEALAKGYRFQLYDVAGDRYRAEVLADVKRWSADWSAISSAGAGLVLFGPVGTGKDHLMVAAVRRLIIEAGISARLVNGRELAAECRAAIAENKPDRSIVGEYLAPDVLILSDPTPPRGDLSTYQADILYQIADGRAKRGRLTCATVNIADEREADEKLGAPTWDRLVAGAWLIECAWSSFRRPAFVKLRPERGDK